MLNLAILMGRLTADPELRQTKSGIATCSFTVAVDRSFAKSGEERKADFINIIAWRQAAEFVCKYFHKGNMIAVDGQIQTRNYVDKNGAKRTAFEVVASNINFTGERATDAHSSVATNANTSSQTFAPAAGFPNVSVDDFKVIDDNEDLPF
ncbi:MAG: single-stranded DNA-binding protein [Ruthenibacterium sp.]